MPTQTNTGIQIQTGWRYSDDVSSTILIIIWTNSVDAKQLSESNNVLLLTRGVIVHKLVVNGSFKTVLIKEDHNSALILPSLYMMSGGWKLIYSWVIDINLNIAHALKNNGIAIILVIKACDTELA